MYLLCFVWNKNRKMTLCRQIFVVILLCRAVQSYSSYQKLIPNGDRVPSPCNTDGIWDGIGHTIAEGGGKRNQFGLDFLSLGKTWSADLCSRDSDGDGRTNGEELGDPDCLWKEGESLNATVISHPGICEPIDDPNCKKKNDWLKCKGELDCPALKESGVKHFDLRFPKTKVPAQQTTYKCIVVDVPTDGDYHIIGNTPIIDNIRVLHHMLLYGCNEQERKTTLSIGTPYECGMTPGDMCSRELIGVWTGGGRGECLTDKAGYRMGVKGYKRLALQIHWNNHLEESGNFDASGLRLYYTANRRPYDAGILWVGQQYLEIPPHREFFTVDGTCSGECTSAMFKGKISVFAAMNHMHLLGRGQSVAQYRENTYIRHITNETQYDFNGATQYRFDQPIEVLPGDELRTSCIYNSKKRSTTTMFGEGTDSEMCITFLKYYPKQSIPSPICLAYKDLQLCKIMEDYKELFPDGLKGCQLHKFSSLSNPLLIRSLFEMKQKCKPYMCIKECKDLLLRMKKEPCLQDDVFDFVKFYMFHGAENNFVADQVSAIMPQFTSCDLELGKEAGYKNAQIEMTKNIQNNTLPTSQPPNTTRTVLYESTTTTTTTDAVTSPSLKTCPKCPPVNICRNRNTGSKHYRDCVLRCLFSVDMIKHGLTGQCFKIC